MLTRMLHPICISLLFLHSSIIIAATTDLSGGNGWSALTIGANFDYLSDSQSNKAGTEIIGDASHPSSYVNYDNKGTTTGNSPESDDILSLRLRIGDENKSKYSAYTFFAVDADRKKIWGQTTVYP